MSCHLSNQQDISATQSAGSEQEKAQSDTLESDDSGVNQPQMAASGETRPTLQGQTSKDSATSLLSEAGESHCEDHDHNMACSDSGDADDDSDGGDTVVPRSKASSNQKHDSSALRQLAAKRRRKRPRRKRKVLPLVKVNSGDKVCVEVVCTHTTVDVVWQDGTESNRLLSTELTPVFHLDELEFFPGDFISDKRGTSFLTFSLLKCLFYPLTPPPPQRLSRNNLLCPVIF